MWDLNEAKYEQNPELKRQLIETAPALWILNGYGLAPLAVTSISRAKSQVLTSAGTSSGWRSSLISWILPV